MWVVWAEQNPQYLLRLARKELNVPNLKSSKELTVLIYILWLKGTLEDLKTYLNTDILPDEPKMSPEWIFMPLIYCNDVEEVSICSSCEKYIIKGIQTFNQSIYLDSVTARPRDMQPLEVLDTWF